MLNMNTNNLLLATIIVYSAGFILLLGMLGLIYLGEVFDEWRGKKRKTPEEIAQEFLNKYK